MAVPDPHQLESERQLYERAQSGDRQALGALLKQHGPRLFRSVLLPRLGNVALAEEALGVTYIKAVERFSLYRWQPAGVYPWLRVVALRVALDQLKARRRETLFDPAYLERELNESASVDQEASVLERHDLARTRQRVHLVLERINPRYAQAIRLRILEDRSREQAAEMLGVGVATFDVLLHRAMASLRKVLATRRRSP